MEIKISKEPDQVVVRVTGRVDTVTSVELEEAVNPLFEEGVRKLCMDCAAVEYISSAGIRFFVTAHKQMESKGGSFVLQHLNKQVLSVLTLTGLAKKLNII